MGKKVQEIMVDDIMERINSGELLPWQKAWNLPGGFPRNAVSCKEYRGFNLLWLTCQGYSNPFWLTWNQIKNLGGHLKEGSRHTKVIFFKINRKDDVSDEGEIVERAWPLMRFYRVWNLEQTEGVKLPKKAQAILSSASGPKFNHTPIEECERIWEDFEHRPKLEFGKNPCYIPSKDTIGMPEIGQFSLVHEYYSSLFHEMGHATGHWTRLDRKELSYAKEELVAEITACFLCGRAGIEKHILDNSAAYIDTWRKRISEDPKLVFQAATLAQKAYDHIIGQTAAEPGLESDGEDEMKEAV